MPTRRDFLAAAALGPAAAMGATPPAAAADGEPPLPAGAFRRLGSARFRCGRYSFIFTDDGRHLASCSSGMVEVWDAATGRWLRRFRYTTPEAREFAYLSPSGRVTVLCHEGHERWHVRGLDLFGKPLYVSPSRELPGSVWRTFDPAGERFFHATDRRLATFDARTLAPLWAFDFAETKHLSLAVRRDGVELLFRRGAVYLVLDAATGKLLRVADLTGRLRPEVIRGCELSDDGTLFCLRSDSGDNWLSEGEMCHTMVCGFNPGRELWTDTNPQALFGFVAGGKELIAERNGRWCRFDARTGQRLGHVNLQYPSDLSRTADPNMLAFTIGWGSGIGFIDLAANRVLPKSADPYWDLDDLRFDAAGRVVGDVNDLGTQGDRRWLRRDAAGGPAEILEAAPSRDGHSAATLSPDGRRYLRHGAELVELFDAATHRRLAVGGNPHRGKSLEAATFAWSSDGETVAMTVRHSTIVLSAATALAHRPEWFAGFPGGPTFRSAGGELRRVTIVPAFSGGSHYQPTDCIVTSFDVAGGDRKTLTISGFHLTSKVERAGRFAGYEAMKDDRLNRSVHQVRGVETGVVVWEWTPPESHPWCGKPVLSPDGRTVAFSRSVDHGEEAIEFHEVLIGGVRRRVAFEPGTHSVAFDARGRTLLTHHATAPIFLWDVYGERTDPRPKPTAADLDRAWADLASTDAAAGFRAVKLLVQHPAEAVPMLRVKMAAEPRLSADAARERIARLGHPSFPVREAAERDLALAAEDCRELLAESLKTCRNPEAKARLEKLVANAGRPTPSTIRAVRAAESLEAAHTPAARALLAEWATGPGSRLLTREAVATLDRWE